MTPHEQRAETVVKPQQPGKSASRMNGRIALVSGGAGGIGSAIARLLATEGASVLIGDLPESEGKAVAQSIGDAAEFVALDIRDPNEWTRAVDACQGFFGATPDVLVQAAGIMVLGAVDSCDPHDVERAFGVNVLGTLHGIQAVAPSMRQTGRGSIVVVTSMAGVTFGCPGMAPYAASKAAASALARCAALDFAGSGVRVNAVVPGQVDTPMSRAAGVPPEFFAKMPIPRSGQPIDIAHAVLFLASDESSWITGTNLLIDGGMEAGPALG